MKRLTSELLDLVLIVGADEPHRRSVGHSHTELGLVELALAGKPHLIDDVLERRPHEIFGLRARRRYVEAPGLGRPDHPAHDARAHARGLASASGNQGRDTATLVLDKCPLLWMALRYQPLHEISPALRGSRLVRLVP